MNHEDAREAYSLKMDGLLESGPLESLEAHLAECSECREFCAELKQSSEALGALKDVPPVPSDLLAKATANIKPVPFSPQSWWSNWKIPTLVFASSACVVFGVYLTVYKERAQNIPAPADSVIVTPNIIEKKSRPTLSLKTATIIKLPSAIGQDILAIEQFLHSIVPVRPAIIFRGAGDAEDSPLDKKLHRAALKNINITDEIKEALKKRHFRLAAVEALKTSGKVGENYNGLLAVLPNSVTAISESEKNTIKAENRDRAVIMRIHAGQLSKQLGRAEDIVEPELARQYGSAFKKLIHTGDWFKPENGNWQQIK